MTSLIQKAIVYAFISELLCPIPILAQEWECEACPPRSLGLYDCDVQVPKPTWLTPVLSLEEWISMFFTAAGIHEKLAVDDPSSECFFIIDGLFINQADSLGSLDSLSYDEEITWMNLPPPGPVDYVDYLVTGSVTGTLGIYSITVQLEAAGTREIVASGNVFYYLSESGLENGRRAAEFLVPLMATVREFEKTKRDEDETVAIDAELELIPEKIHIDVNESIDVTIRLIDCDEVPLEGRTVHLSAEGGSFSPDSVETDSEGEAVAIFTAGSSPGGGLLEGEYKYEYPFGHGPIYAWGDTNITIDQPPSDLWQVNATFSETVTQMADTSWSWDIEGGYRFDYDNRYVASANSHAHLSGLIRNESGDGDFVYSMNEDPLVMTASGSYSEHENEKMMEYLSGEIPIFGGYLSGKLAQGSQMRTDWLNGSFDEGGFYFECSPTYQYVSLYAGGEGNANYKIRTWDGDHWNTSHGSSKRECSLNVGWSQGESGGYIGYSDSVYTFSYSQTVTERRTTYDFGMLTEITKQRLSGSIRPSSRMETGIGKVERQSSLGSPCGFGLDAFPNPFNNATVIRYRVRTGGRVRVIILDVLGRTIETVVDTFRPPGTHTTVWQPVDVPSGIYIAELEAGKRIRTMKLLYVR